jgi:hypothetical protein
MGVVASQAPFLEHLHSAECTTKTRTNILAATVALELIGTLTASRWLFSPLVESTKPSVEDESLLSSGNDL